MGFEGKIALVTGGSRGIGKSIVLDLIKKGAKVAFTYLSGEKEALELQSQAASMGGDAVAFRVDVGNFEDAKRMCNEVVGKFGRIDILVNNAGKTRDKTLLVMEPDDWNDVINTNLTGMFNVTKNCIFHMLKNKSGRIVNLSSISGIEGLPGQTNYSASKAGIIGFTRALAKEVAAYGITVNTVAPGGVKTAMIEGMSDKAREALLATVPARRFCEPEEVANVVAYLADESPTYMTGNVIVLDGGSGIG
ncbi:MAG: beta-ketoacyl-ACP reductase [Clostridia bacterium]|nr:beta-ketoacyl-ACP reductase [Clostridia bacterium]